MKIIVPATSANLGCGFDSLGLAVNLFLTVEILGQSENWEIEHSFGEQIPSDERNLIVATALKLAPQLLPHRLKMTSEIPLEHGLGSSSSAIVAGIELADCLGGLNLSLEQKLQFACDIEGHPDNVAPAVLGGLAAASYDGHLTYQKLPAPDCCLLATVPPYSLSTQEARKVLPDNFSRGDAVLASSRANVLVAALANQDLKLAGRLMEQDLFHENYRADLIPELAQIRDLAKKQGAYGTYLSGAGSTVMTLIDKEKASSLISELRVFGEVLSLHVEQRGSYVEA